MTMIDDRTPELAEYAGTEPAARMPEYAKPEDADAAFAWLILTYVLVDMGYDLPEADQLISRFIDGHPGDPGRRARIAGYTGLTQTGARS